MKAAFRRILLTALLGAASLCAANYDVNLAVRASWPNHHAPIGNDIATKGRIAYVAIGAAGFDVLDFSNLESPKVVATIPGEGFVGGLCVSGDRLYVTDEAAGLHIFDITNPRQPERLSTLALRGPASGVAVAGSIAVVAARHAGVHVVDVENPEKPKHKNVFDTAGTALRVAVVGMTAYVADYDSGLLALDISNPDAPVSLGSLTTTIRTVNVAANENYVVTATFMGSEVIDRRDTSRRININGRIEDVSISGDYAYLIDNPLALRLVELPASGTPRTVGSYPAPPYNGHTVTAEDGFAFSIQNFAIDVIDFRDPVSPKLASSYSIDNQVQDGVIVGRHAYVLNQRKLNVIDVADPANIVRSGSIALPAEPSRIALSEGIAGITFGESGIGFYDVSDPAAPRELSRVPLPGNVFAITMTGKRAYVSGQDSGLRIIDLANPTEPKIIGATETARISAKTVIYAEHAYVVAYDDGLQIFNIADPANIVAKGAYTNFNGWVRDLALRGTNLFVATDGGLQVYELSDPAKPRLVADDKVFASGISIFGDTAYVGGAGLRVVDISDPAQPQTKLQSYTGLGKVAGLSGSLAYVFNGSFQFVDFVANPQRMTRFPNIGSATNITVRGKYAYLAGASEGLRIVDTSHSSAPQVVGHQAEPVTAIEVRGNRAYAGGANGFRIVDVSKPDEIKTIGAITGHRILDVAVAGRFAYAIIAPTTMHSPNSLAVIDCTDLTKPIVGKLVPCFGDAIAIEGEHVYVTDYGVRVFDISDPRDPKEIGLLNSIGTALPNDIAARGKYVYLAGNWFGFFVIDVSDPTNPWVVGRSNDSQQVVPVRLSISGDHAYTYDMLGNLHVLNIERPGHPRRIGGNDHVNAAALFASTDTLYISDRAGGLTILDLFRPDAGSMRLTSLEPIDGAARIRANGPAGETVQIEKLQDGVWKPWKPLTAENSPVDIVDPEAAGVQIYRIAKP